MPNSVTQSAVNLTVYNNPIRAGSYPGGYRIINTSLTATVWASDNSSVADGQGTSISPGTSLGWMKGGDLFLVLGKDALSIAAGSAPVIISYDVNDWQPAPAAIAAAILQAGVLIVDQPVTLFDTLTPFGPRASGAYPVNLGTFDVSRYNSVSLCLEANALTAQGKVALNWLDANGNILASDIITVPFSAASVYAATAPVFGTTWRFACKGPKLSLQVGWPAVNPQGLLVQLTASNRPSYEDRTLVQTAGTGNGVFLGDNSIADVNYGLAIAPSASINWTTTPVWGTCQFTCRTNKKFDVAIQYTGGNGLYTRIPIDGTGPYSWLIGGEYWGLFTVICAGSGLILSATNRDTTNATYFTSTGVVLER